MAHTYSFMPVWIKYFAQSVELCYEISYAVGTLEKCNPGGIMGASSNQRIDFVIYGGTAAELNFNAHCIFYIYFTYYFEIG